MTYPNPVITAALTGPVATSASNPELPGSTTEIAEVAKGTHEAGPAPESHKATDAPEESALRKPITRRDFLKVAGVTVAHIGAGGGLGSLLAACGGGGGGSTSGRTIKLGLVSPLTGGLAPFGEADVWCVEQWKAYARDGIQCGDGVVHPIEFILKDSQSNTDRASTVAGELITNDGVDIMMVASSADTAKPVATQAETLEVPCVSSDCPWQPYFLGRQKDPANPVPFTWTYHFFWGLEDVTANFIAMWDKLQTNKLVGEMWGNNADGIAWSDPKTGQPPMLAAGGYEFIDGGRIQDGTDDFTPQITKFKDAGVDIVGGNMLPPDFVDFWTQCVQKGLKPKACTIGKALLFPSQVEAVGDIGNGLSTECWWTPSHPFKSSLTGQTDQEIGDAFTADTGKQWTQPLLHYAVFEVVADALKRTKNVDDKQSIVDAIKTTKLDTMCGPVDWNSGSKTVPVLSNGFVVANVSKTPLVGGQWVKGQKYPFELMIVNNSTAPEIATQAEMQALAW
jgi:branched-chain amino acid transport system substrate-binding protein